jgi:hypothetical protein
VDGEDGLGVHPHPRHLHAGSLPSSNPHATRACINSVQFYQK